MSEDHPQLISPRMLPAALRQASKFGVRREPEPAPPKRPPPPASQQQQQQQGQRPGDGNRAGSGGPGKGQGLSVTVPSTQGPVRGPAEGHPPTARSPLGMGPRPFSSTATPTGQQRGGGAMTQEEGEGVRLMLKVVPRVHLFLTPTTGSIADARSRPVKAQLKVGLSGL
jgi:hypothetical protein